ncbi:MAG TPA: ribosome assembly cofactor RimP [Prolixibacteraceae bacterium]|jgi:ribosome maturation factor RimP|nr:MAG: Ribosome maturation factor RimP [Bacteroidetes bacterium ADurb.Bin123]HNU77206.1 ribosome assembly cofactor RimP [Prolixibacteraceae bacterium]
MSPILLLIMITKEKITEIVGEKLEEGMFLVDVNVTPSQVIHVEIDSMDGITIDQCVAVSRFVEAHLNRENEDFELQVSSPGIDQFFKVNRQFHKNVGRELDVVTAQNLEVRGKLMEAGQEGIVLEVTTREQKEGEKKKQWVTRQLSLGYDDIKKARVVISFK